MTSPEDRQAEIDKYQGVPGVSVGAYNLKNYAMTDCRRELLCSLLREEKFVLRGSYLDVSCGRGESLKAAHNLTYNPAVGTEVVDFLLDEPWKVKAVLPDVPFGDKVFDTISCIDVMEHILRDDWDASIINLGRVCKRRLILVISNEEDRAGKALGTILHVTRLPYEETELLIKGWLPDFDVVRRYEHEPTDAAVWDCMRR